MNDPTDKREFLRELILSGMSMREASISAGTKYSTARMVYDALVRAGEISYRPRMLRAEMDETAREEIFAKVSAGLRQKDIAEQYGVSVSTIARVVQDMINHGRKIERKKLIRPDSEFYRHGINRGRINDIFAGLTNKQISMIMREIPAGCTVADWLRGVVRDVVDEMEDGK